MIVPEFSKKNYPSSTEYNLGNMFDSSGNSVRESEWSFSTIEHIFDYVVELTSSRQEGYYIYGHSAGGQFVHRLVTFLPDARVKTAIAANAGWYTLPEKKIPMPYGLKNSGLRDKGLKAAFEKELVIALGDQDINENDKYLRKTPEALAQGKHRFERGKTYFASAEKNAKKLRSAFNWKLKIVRGVGHSNSGMAEQVVKILFK